MESSQNYETDPLRRRERILLLLLLCCLELWIFTGSFHKYFTRDSLFYMTNIPHSWEELRPFFLAPSQEMSFRPVNLAVAALLSLFLGMDPQLWHWVPVVFHIANTLLFYFIGRRILPDSVAALAAAGFWALHSVAGWITYDITYLSDFLLAFLFLASILLALEGRRRKSRLLVAGALVAFSLSLMTKEAAITFPLGIWIALILADMKSSAQPANGIRIFRAAMDTLPTAALFICVDVIFMGLFSYWIVAGRIYSQSATSAYHIQPFANWVGKAKYLFWAGNLPDSLHIPNAAKNYTLVMGLSVGLLVVWGIDILRRRLRLTWIEWAGVVWFAGMNIPSLLLSQRLAKWYLYIPLFGLALAFGILVRNLGSLAGWTNWRAAIPLVLLGAVAFPSAVQTRSYIVHSDSAYESRLLENFVTEFRKGHLSLPPEVTLFFLPAFEEGISQFLASDPIGHGELIHMYYPGTKVTALHAFRGDPLPPNGNSARKTVILQPLDGHFHDVTRYFARNGRMTLYLLPTPEREIAPLFKKEPAGGKKRFGQYVQIECADQGTPLPENYPARGDLWVLQYIDGHFDDVTDLYVNRQPNTMFVLPTLDDRPPRLRGLERDPQTAARMRQSHVRILKIGDMDQIPSDYANRTDLFFVQYLGGRFTDITDYFRGRRAAKASRVARSLDGARFAVNRAEFYPDYDRFDTPTGKPAFFSAPANEILTQIGGSTVAIPLPTITRGSRLCFDVSWMNPDGDGGWAEASVRAGDREIVVYREYFTPDPKATSLLWKEVSFDLQGMEGPGAELILKCYNKAGGNTAADWLNWRDITLDSAK